MASHCSQREVVLDILEQLHKAIADLMDWNRDVPSQDELQKSPGGMQKLAGNCMMIQAICEGFKQIDNRTEGKLLALRPEIPWRQVKGMRDRIAHGYFDLDVEYIDDIIKNDLGPILVAVDFFIDSLSKEK